MPLGSNYPKTCTQTQEDEKETRMREEKEWKGERELAKKTTEWEG